MNNIEKEILNYLRNNHNFNQRGIAKKLNISLGKVNHILNNLKEEHFINHDGTLTDESISYLDSLVPRRAVILAAGMGFRMIPLNKQVNKAFLNANGDSLIERLIKQLNKAEVFDITIVVGYKKEEFDFLIDKYNVNLCVNKDYRISNSMHSLYKAKDKLENCYILPCDIYFYDNPFLIPKPYSWFMLKDIEGNPLLPKRKKVTSKWFKDNCNQEIGVAYLTYEDNPLFGKLLEDCVDNSIYTNAFWEEIIHISKLPLFEPITIKPSSFVECNECDDLITLDDMSTSLNGEVFDIIMNVFNIKKTDIKNIKCAKAGMTNNSFLFNIQNKKYIMRIPGEGTDFLINRKQEYEVYQSINEYQLSDKVHYFNSENGYKITKFIDNAHNCDINNQYEVKLAIKYLREFHKMKLKVNHEFDLFDRIDYYESLWNGKSSAYSDYKETKHHVFELKNIINKYETPYVLTHIDAVPDNFVFHEEDGKTKINLIDWEYAAMQDPHLDIAMFAIYALYDKKQIDDLISMYFDNNETKEYKIKIYCYIAAAGLLWSNWCEYKSQLGIEFGEYSLRQYRYAKDFYRIVQELKEVEKYE